jgi:thiamine pyrophosphate-dependent acetolactate synthase large subunit-like protein
VNRIDCVEAFARLRGQALVVVSPGYTSHELAQAGHQDLTLYNMDMGYAAPVCLGLALARPDERVVALEGDGSLLMGLSTLTTAARYAPPNLTIIVFDNSYYLTTGSGQVHTATAGHADLAALGRAAGFLSDRVLAVDDLSTFETGVARALSQPGPWLVVARVDTSDRGDPRARGEFPTDLTEQAVLFQVALRARLSPRA